METREARNKRLGIRPRAKPSYPTTKPAAGSYWIAIAAGFSPAYFTTVKDMVEYIEPRKLSIIQFVRQ